MLHILIALIAGLLIITAFFYGGQLMLHWLEVRDLPPFSSFMSRPGPNLTVARAPRLGRAFSDSGLALAEPVTQIKSFNRFDDDGGNQHL